MSINLPTQEDTTTGRAMSALGELTDQTVTIAVLLAVAIGLGYFLGTLLRKLFQRFAQDTPVETDDIILKYCTKPLRLILTSAILLLEVSILTQLSSLNESVDGLLRQCVSIPMILGVTWLLIGIMQVLETAILRRYDMQVSDNLAARKMHTQLRVIKRIAIMIIFIVGVSCLLMTFEKVRQLGTSLLASAGIAGVIIGFAAQRSLATIIAGLQIALTQPIRIDDVVIVEGEWGRIEEITLTYVVVRIWDLRRLIVPITFFIERPFQNWTRVSADILGTVFIYVDYTVPTERIRDELQQIVSGSDLWDGKVCGLQVTNATEQTMELRALMSSLDSSKSWDLRCLVRERLIAFIQREYPQALPRTRVALDRPRPDGASADSAPPNNS